MSRILIAGAPVGLAVAIGFAASAAMAGTYVSNDLSEVKPEQWVKIPHPQPIQLFVEFQTNGASNPRATALVKDTVVSTVKSSALFSDVSDQAVPGGALLHVVINDVADSAAKSEASGKGFTTGLTFGLVGNTVTEGYDCTVEYAAGPAAAKLSNKVHHRLFIQIGLTAPTPPNATRAASTKEAVLTMARQCTANPLNSLAALPAFQGQAAVEAPTTAPSATAPNPGPTPAPPPSPAPSPTPNPTPGTAPSGAAPATAGAPAEPHA